MSAMLCVLAACGGADTAASPAGNGAGVDVDDGGDAGVNLNDDVPGCPFTVAQVTDLMGQPMVDRGPCSFNEADGVGFVTITMSSEFAASVTYDFERQQAEEIYLYVKDIDKGKRGFLAVMDTKAQAEVISSAGSYSVSLNSFEFTADQYEQTLRRLLDALPI